MEFSIEGYNNGSIGVLGNNLTELKEALLGGFERMEAHLWEAKSTASREAQQYEKLWQMEVGMLEAQLQEKEESLRTKESAIKQLQENFTAKVQELEQQKEDLSGLLDKQKAEIRSQAEAKISMLEAQLQEKEETLLTKESAISQLQENFTAKVQELEHRLTEKEDLTGLLEQRTAEITNLRMAKKKNIMVVDDNPDIVTIVKTLLEVKGYKVQSAYSGQEVFNLLAKQKPDLIILDIMMPRMDGLEVLTRLKGDSNTRPIPVVLLTAKQPDEAILGGYDIWADSYITKPFTNPQLLNVINRLIGEA